jgi:hypothetical protein
MSGLCSALEEYTLSEAEVALVLAEGEVLYHYDHGQEWRLITAIDKTECGPRWEDCQQTVAYVVWSNDLILPDRAIYRLPAAGGWRVVAPIPTDEAPGDCWLPYSGVRLRTFMPSYYYVRNDDEFESATYDLWVSGCGVVLLTQATNPEFQPPPSTDPEGAGR